MKEKQLKALGAKFSGSSKSSPMMVSTLAEWYDAKHREASNDEISFINSLEADCCPYCGSRSIRKDGLKKSGLRCYECAWCGRKFTPITNTIFDSRKIPLSEWVEYLSHLFELHSVATSASDNRNADSTGRYWLSKVFMVLRGYQDAMVLSGKVWADETYIPRWKTKRITKDGKELRGLSRNQFAIYSLTDGDRCFLKLVGVGKPSEAKAMKAYSGRIAKGSVFVHDGERSHGIVMKELGLIGKSHKTEETKGLNDKDNPMEPINEVHRELKKFLSRHGGYSRENLQDWLNLFAFIFNTPGDKYQKAQIFIEMAIKMRMRLRFREWAKPKMRG
jgi:transposase-like protein